MKVLCSQTFARRPL